MEKVTELVIAQPLSIQEREFGRGQIVELVRLYGAANSDAVLDPAILIFGIPGVYGFIGYKREFGVAVVFGDPVCAIEDRERLSKAFHAFAKEERLSIVYVCVSAEFASWAMPQICKARIEFGEELFFDPPSDPRKKTGTYASLVRRKVKQAIREGVTIHEYTANDTELEKEIEAVGQAWLKGRQGPQVHISNVYLFDDRLGKRWFYAKQGGRVIGTLSLNQLRSKQGYLINHLMVLPDAPNGTSELLFTTVLEELEKSGCPYASVGMIARSDLGEIAGLSPFSTWVARRAFKIASKFLKLDGLNTFWGKFHPQSKPSYLLFSQKRITIAQMIALSRAMNGPV